MFYFLKGALALLKPTFAVIDAGGVGYKVTIGERTYASLSGKSEAKLFTHLAVREDGVELFGFPTEQELDTFLLLTSVSGVHPPETFTRRRFSVNGCTSSVQMAADSLMPSMVTSSSVISASHVPLCRYIVFAR